jgi:hypothetical protein
MKYKRPWRRPDYWMVGILLIIVFVVDWWILQ